jgi:hypothetical protein
MNVSPKSSLKKTNAAATALREKSAMLMGSKGDKILADHDNFFDNLNGKEPATKKKVGFSLGQAFGESEAVTKKSVRFASEK